MLDSADSCCFANSVIEIGHVASTSLVSDALIPISFAKARLVSASFKKLSYLSSPSCVALYNLLKSLYRPGPASSAAYATIVCKTSPQSSFGFQIGLPRSSRLFKSSIWTLVEIADSVKAFVYSIAHSTMPLRTDWGRPSPVYSPSLIALSTAFLILAKPAYGRV